MPEEKNPSQYPDWQDTYLETAYSQPYTDTPPLPYVDTRSQPFYGSPPPQSASAALWKV